LFDSSDGALALDPLQEPQEDPAAPFGPEDPFREYFGRMPRFSQEVGAEIFKRAETWQKMTEGNGLMRQWRENFRLYHNAEPSGVGFGDRSFSVEGEHDETLRVRFNEFRNLLTHILNMTTTQKVAMQSKASNAESSSILAAQLYDGVLDYFITQWKRSRSNKQLRKAVELCLFMSNGYVLVEWDAAAGEPYTADESGAIVNTGDLYVKARSVLDVYFDTNAEDEDELDVVVIRDFMNKYELAERIPDKRDEILTLESKTEQESHWGWDEETDLVPVYKAYWKSSKVLPKGRMVWALSPELVVLDMDNPYQDDHGQAVIPLLTVRAAEGIGSCFGYGPGNDLAPVQMALNMIWSSVLTNEAAFGVGNIAVERGSDIAVQSLAGGLNVIEYAEGKKPPAPFSVSSNEGQSLEAVKAVSAIGEKISGVNSVVRGNPEDALKAASGRALGLIQAMAVQFQSALQASYQQLVQDFGNLLLLIIKRFAHAPQVAKIIGRDKVAKLSTWQGSDFMNVAQVVAEPVNPMAKTIAGARERGEFLVSQGMVTDLEAFHTIETTGQIEPLIEDKLTRNNLIAQENEQLLHGKKPLVLRTDPHPMHIMKHLILLDSPQVRENSAIVSVVLAHVAEHEGYVPQQMPMPQDGAQTGTGAPQQGQPTQTEQPQQQEQQAPGPGGTSVPVPETAQLPAMGGM
jgi:hypothetical protein